MSDIDLKKPFYSALLPGIQQNPITVNIGQGVARTLKEAITQAVSVDVYVHDPILTGQNLRPTRFHATPADPHAMDIDATHTSNGNTRETFLARMRGQCFVWLKVMSSRIAHTEKLPAITVDVEDIRKQSARASSWDLDKAEANTSNLGTRAQTGGLFFAS
ncbi:gag protein [Lentinula edodes]|uniref:Gag protein n=1 Tax=Lentinula edodes TaxID=5353 RepID=A0A1Q3E7A7_LENED|nr:gag protein [Lentinula edodes]